MREGAVLCMVGIVGGTIAAALGGWDHALRALVLFMVLDFISGWTVAAVFRKSKKSKNGSLESGASYKGLIRKGKALVLVLVAYNIDIVFDINLVRYCVIIGFMATEVLSIVENAGLMGVPVPSILRKIMEIFRDNEVSNE